MKKIFIISAVVLTILACNKDKFETKPYLEFKSFNTDVVDVGNDLRIRLNYTDQEGDLDSIYIIRQRLNKKSPRIKLLDFVFPKFNNERKGEIFITLANGTQLLFDLPQINIPGTTPTRFEPDTLQFKFVVKDKEGNKSDTATSSVVYVNR